MAREAAAQVTAWQARLAEAVGGLLGDPVVDSWRSYLAFQLGLTPGEAGQVLELVDRLAELPVVAGVFERGERSMGAVLALARRATPELEAELVASSQCLTGGQLQVMLREYERVVAPSKRSDVPPDDPSEQPSSVRDRRCRSGRRQVVLELDEADAAEWDRAIEAERAGLADGPDEPSLAGGAACSAAQALMALLRRADAARRGGVEEPVFAAESVSTTLVIHARETDDGLVIDRSVFAGEWVPSWIAAVLAERGPISAMVVANGVPVFATQPVRFATARQRRALLVRDRHCRYPGCTCARGLIAHHVRYFDDGGPTRLDNLVLLCKRHHRVVHRFELRIAAEPGGEGQPPQWSFTTAGGRPLVPSWPHLPPERRRARAGPRVTGVGEPLTDYAKDVLLHHWLTTPTATAA